MKLYTKYTLKKVGQIIEQLALSSGPTPPKKILDLQHNQLSSKVERWMYEGSALTFNSMIQY